MSFRLRFTEGHRNAYPVRLMCAELEVSPAGYYAWRGRLQSARATANATLLAERQRQRYGSARSMQFCGRRDVVPAAAGPNG
ncbi:hypothetical protein AB8Z38_17770 [Bradyrhizobium sp. LLZ17]|uniref:Transposase n=1 Tax=Bradyrhizobium sp. LLZ17 TaxID=3239388 RepID=A0AB39XUT5_9BRAD